MCSSVERKDISPRSSLLVVTDLEVGRMNPVDTPIPECEE